MVAEVLHFFFFGGYDGDIEVGRWELEEIMWSRDCSVLDLSSFESRQPGDCGTVSVG